MQVTVVTHYALNDPECISDYCYIELLLNGEPIIAYGDAYHAKGREKVEGFIDCLSWMIRTPLYNTYDDELNVTFEDVSDYDTGDVYIL